MLTKDLVKFRFRGAEIVPCFLDPHESQVRDMGEELLSLFENAKGQQACKMKENLEQCNFANHPAFSGFAKLLFDRCSYVEDESIEDDRWQKIIAAQALRREQLFESKEAFQEILSTEWGASLEKIQDGLYGDLPEFQVVKGFESIDVETLIHRYNCALVQGLLLFATKLRVYVGATSLVERRNLFRAIKFHRLVVGNVVNKEASFSFELEGPLSVVMNTHAYGIRMANVFPHLLLLNDWRVEALLKMKNRDVRLELSEKHGLRSHYKDAGGFIPQEFECFVKSFNEKYAPWIVRWNDQLLYLGGQEFCFPDLIFSHAENGKIFYFELFHRWHRGELLKRLETIQKLPSHPLRIGVCQSLYKQDTIRTFVEKGGKCLDKFLVAFREFPTPKHVNPFLT